MKKNHIMLSLCGTIRKYRALANIRRVLFSVKSMPGTEVLPYGNSYQEKLQIIYANIRV